MYSTETPEGGSGVGGTVRPFRPSKTMSPGPDPGSATNSCEFKITEELLLLYETKKQISTETRGRVRRSLSECLTREDVDRVEGGGGDNYVGSCKIIVIDTVSNNFTLYLF